MHIHIQPHAGLYYINLSNTGFSYLPLKSLEFFTRSLETMILDNINIDVSTDYMMEVKNMINNKDIVFVVNNQRYELSFISKNF